MNTSLDTSFKKYTKKKKRNPHYFLFPAALYGKELEINPSSSLWDQRGQALLKWYLKTKDPDILIEAIREIPNLPQGRGQNLTVYQRLGRASAHMPTYVDAHSIVSSPRK